MTETSLYLNKFFTFLSGNQPFLFISEASELKRTIFLNHVAEKMDQDKTCVYFRLKGETFSLDSLVHQVTEQFFIPVRSVNVNILRQLQDQLRILQHINQKVVLLIDDAHRLSTQNLTDLLKFISYQEEFAMFPVVLLGNPSLEKRLHSIGKFSPNIPFEQLSFSEPSPAATPATASTKIAALFSISMLTAWLSKRQVRLISLFLLLGVMWILSQWENLEKRMFLRSEPSTQHREKISQKKSPPVIQKRPQVIEYAEPDSHEALPVPNIMHRNNT